MSHRILHVEDNPDELLLTRMAFERAGIPVKIDTAVDGEAAIAALRGNITEAVHGCVLLDIKLPGKSGLEVLAWMRQQPQLRRLPAIMFSSSVLSEDINKAYDLGANSYLTKPGDLDSLMALAEAVYHYWLETNTPPSISAMARSTATMPACLAQ